MTGPARGNLNHVSALRVPTVGVVILHMGNRPEELTRALADLRAQVGVELDVVVVGNGWQPQGLPAWVRTVHVPENVGIPQGRNIGAEQVRGEYIFFFDDDATMPEPDVLARLVEVVRTRPHAALCQPGLSDPSTGATARRWVPRLRVRRNESGGQVASFSEGVVLIRRDAFEQAGRWPGQFFFGHEGIELAWQLTDLGWTLWYDPSIRVHHPLTEATRHDLFYRTNARNRVWVARRNLPLPLVPVYLGTWMGITVLRVRELHALRVWGGGFLEGVRTDPGRRRPISWGTVAKLTRIGRPPVI